MASEEPWVGIAEVAAHLEVAQDAACRRVGTQGLPAHRVVGRLFRFRLSQVDEWVEISVYHVAANPKVEARWLMPHYVESHYGKLNELLHDVAGRTAAYVDSMTAAPYRPHFYEITVQGQTTKGESTTIHAELAAVREEVAEGVSDAERFGPVPADVLIDLPEHPYPPETAYGSASYYVKTTVQMEHRSAARDERGRYAYVARDHLRTWCGTRLRTPTPSRSWSGTPPSTWTTRRRRSSRLATYDVPASVVEQTAQD